MSEPSASAIQTYTGRWVDVFDPDPEQIVIEDIAHALSLLPRFGGHARFGWTVAQHSIVASLLCPAPDRLAALLHDASEAYLIDMPRPIKKHPKFAAYEDTEFYLMTAIALKFGFGLPLSPAVKHADELCLFAEAHALFRHGYENWPAVWKKPASDEVIHQLSLQVMRRDPEEVEEAFLGLFHELKSKEGR